MRKMIFALLLLTLALTAQDFSDVAASTDTYLNFESNQEDELPLYIDEESALVWQNSEELPLFKNQSKASHYCKTLKLGDHQWMLPTFKQLKSLKLFSYIHCGNEDTYLSKDQAVWDNNLTLAYNAKKDKKTFLLPGSKALRVRCVSSLED